MWLDEIQQSYSQAIGKWTGCDWPTEFGQTRINLDGITAQQALLMAGATSGLEADDWLHAFDWLSQIERKAKAAQDFANRAVDLAADGKAVGAIIHVQKACMIEGEYHERLIWQPLREAIESSQAAIEGSA